MSDQQSANSAPRVHLSLEEFLPLMLSAAGALGILPFAIIRFVSGEWLIGILDAGIVTGFTVLGIFVLRSRRVRAASVCITVLGLLGTLLTVYLKGPQQMYWAYPALVIAYYLLRPVEAVAASLVMVLALAPLLRSSVDTFPMTTMLISLFMTAVFAYAFATLTAGQRRQLMNLATRDPLTGAGNRRALNHKISDVLASYDRTGLPVSLVLLDLDRFKEINDDYGHGAGDRILVQLTEILNL
ncbi:MAG TPA: GGDEF domain-containing protein, partial [Woeseiaceae bacterium]|nr:GGDEF domain-containing protein [Woeseiaceae bacterium]